MALIDDYHLDIDVLVIDSALPGASPLIASLRNSCASMHVIAVTADPEILRSGFAQVDAVRRPPQYLDDDTKEEWVQLIKALIGSPAVGAV